jgi:hypothetical protein
MPVFGVTSFMHRCRVDCRVIGDATNNCVLFQEGGKRRGEGRWDVDDRVNNFVIFKLKDVIDNVVARDEVIVPGRGVDFAPRPAVRTGV